MPKVWFGGLQIRIESDRYVDTFWKYIRGWPIYGIDAILFSKRKFALRDVHGAMKIWIWRTCNVRMLMKGYEFETGLNLNIIRVDRGCEKYQNLSTNLCENLAA